MNNFLRKIYYLYYRPKIFFPKNSYSMFGEDTFIKKIFKDQSSGFYVDVGCYHPFEGNNTYLLYKKNWRGINIDVNPFSIELFNTARSKDTNINLAVSNKKTTLKLFYRKKINMLNTVNKEFAEKNFPNGFKEKVVGSDTLSSIIDKTKYKFKEIDFLNIDVEGNEVNVLQSLNFEIYNPKIICVEIHDLNFEQSSVKKILSNKNYEIIWKHKYSFIFRRLNI